MTKYARFFGKDWAVFLYPFLKSDKYLEISRTIKTHLNWNYDLTPNLPDMFNAFKKCRLHKLHTIIITDDPYNICSVNGVKIADGLAFSSADPKYKPSSLQILYEYIDNNIYEGKNLNLTDTYDLSKWAEQGILLLNTNFLSRLGHNISYRAAFKDFNEYLFKKINKEKDSLGIIFIGRQVLSYKDCFTNPTYQIFECENPSYASNCFNWVHNHAFKKLHEFHKAINNIEIKW